MLPFLQDLPGLPIPPVNRVIACETYDAATSSRLSLRFLSGTGDSARYSQRQVLPTATRRIMSRTTVYVAAVVRQQDRILLVRQAAGHSLEGQWTVPWGAVEAGESPMSAAVRETAEEGGVDAEVEGLVGVQELPEPRAGGIAIVYLCRHLGGTPEGTGRETDAAAYFALPDLVALGDPVEPWSDWLVRRVFAGEVVITHSNATNPLQNHGAFV